MVPDLSVRNGASPIRLQISSHPYTLPEANRQYPLGYVILGLYGGSIGIMEKQMETTVRG